MPPVNACTRAESPPHRQRRARRGLPTNGRVRIDDRPRRSGSRHDRARGGSVDVGRGIELCYDQTRRSRRPADRVDRRARAAVALMARSISRPRWPGAAIGSPGSTTGTSADRRTWTYRPPNPVAMLRGGNHPRQYHLGDMARDTVGLLDALGYARCPSGRYLDGRHDRPDGRRPLSRAGFAR